MTKEDRIAALFAEANPVPSLDMLEPLDIDPFESRSKRSSVMTDPTTDQLKPVNRGRWPRLAFLAAVPVVIVAGLLFLGDRNRNVATTPGASLTTPVAMTASSTRSSTTSIATASTAAGPMDLTYIENANLQPGDYYVDHDGSPATSLRAEFTLAEPGWGAFAGVNKRGPGSGTYVAVKFLAVDRVASPACDATEWVPAGETAEAMASALGGIEDFVVQVAPTAVTAYGFDGYHLVLEVPSDYQFGCSDGYFDGYEGPTMGRYYQGPDQVVEFWVLDVEGTPLVIEATWFPDSPAEDVAALTAILDTVVISP